MTLILFLLITLIIAYIRYRPWIDKANGDVIIHYNESRFSNTRAYINLSELFRRKF